MATLILDGTALAARRAPLIARRAALVQAQRGRPPHLLIVAFADDDGRVPHVGRKVRAGAAAGIVVEPLIVPAGTPVADARALLHRRLAAGPTDGVFVQFPFPSGFDGDAFAAAIPLAADIDVMSDAGVAAYRAEVDGTPPVTVSAGLLLLDGYGVQVAGLRGVMVADVSPFAEMFGEALRRCGARMLPFVAPAASDRAARMRDAELVVVAAAQPGIVRSTDLARGAVAIDVGYFNGGGLGDIDVSGGIDHLRAFAPVPGGIGPMTVSALCERVVFRAERGMR